MYRNKKSRSCGIGEYPINGNGCIEAWRGFGDPDRSRAVKTDFHVHVRPPVPWLRGGRNGRYMFQSRIRLTTVQVRDLHAARRVGQSLRSLAHDYGVSYETIRQVVLEA